MRSNEKKGLKRSEFLVFAWAAASVGLFWQAGISLFNFLKPTIRPGSFGTKVIAGKVDEFEPGTVSHVQKGRFYISRLEDGGFLALWQRCTHLGCTVPWLEDGAIFNCPCHSSIFTPTGDNLSGPAPRPMDLFEMEIVEDVIIVDTGKSIERASFNASQVTYS